MQDQVTLEGYSLTVVFKTVQAEVYTVAGHPDTLIVRALASYIPHRQFQQLFSDVYDIAEKASFKTVIFDKRRLLVFHQPSMEWYFLIWKQEMVDVGVTRHRKLLPKYETFRTAARVVREKLYGAHPDKRFHQLDICYAESLKEALES